MYTKKGALDFKRGKLKSAIKNYDIALAENKKMGLLNIKLKGKYTLKCIKFLVFWIFIPLLFTSLYLMIFQTEKLELILKIIFHPVVDSV